MSKRKLFLKGQRFGKLLVLEDLDKKDRNGRYYCKCKCDCGKIIDILAISLKNNTTKSCGCLKRKLFLKGQRFGKLLVLEDLDKKDRNGNYYCKCKCDCGKIINVLNTNLKKLDHTKSCGCIQQTNLKNYVKIDNSTITIASKKLLKTNKSGITGVSFQTRSEKWVAELTFQKKRYSKKFNTKEEAIQYRKFLEDKYHNPQIEKWKEEGKIK